MLGRTKGVSTICIRRLLGTERKSSFVKIFRSRSSKFYDRDPKAIARGDQQPISQSRKLEALAWTPKNSLGVVMLRFEKINADQWTWDGKERTLSNPRFGTIYLLN